ncbi:MAG TPA: hypothetical protein VMA83_02310 [Solirubrobacteraceae bacterium]|nr:hypothetical protein [Solirubrobacteraceae bacterium]
MKRRDWMRVRRGAGAIVGALALFATAAPAATARAHRAGRDGAVCAARSGRLTLRRSCRRGERRLALRRATGASKSATITTCVAHSGVLRFVTSAARCHHGEKVLRWNVEGARGAEGKTGPEGKPGGEGKPGPEGAPPELSRIYSSDNLDHEVQLFEGSGFKMKLSCIEPSANKAESALGAISTTAGEYAGLVSWEYNSLESGNEPLSTTFAAGKYFSLGSDYESNQATVSGYAVGASTALYFDVYVYTGEASSDAPCYVHGVAYEAPVPAPEA